MQKFVLNFFFLFITVASYSQLNMQLASQIDYQATLNDIWGWHNPVDGREYAIVGQVPGVSIVDVTDPYNAVEVAFIPGINSTWRDIKTWGSTAYVSNEAGDGIMVIDLSQLPNSAPSYLWQPYISGLNGTLWRCHNLYIDENGIMYPTGCRKQEDNSRLNGGGAIYVDVASNPGNPEVIGWGPSVYAHDIFARGDTLYTSEIYEGRLGIYDISDKSNAVFLASQNTPFNFTHNAWLSDNSKVVFTTDERGNAPVTAYDISDLDDIKYLDEYRPLTSLSTGTVPHNVHVWDDYLIISYYTDGGRVVDASRPSNLIEVGTFDSYFGGDGGFGGVWGAYPFLPSQTVLLSDRQNGLIVCIPNYVRACWLEGTVTEKGTGNLLSGVDVHIESAQANLSSTGNNGRYETGQALAGDFIVTYEKSGYRSKAVTVNLQNGVLTELDVELEPLVSMILTGTIVDSITGEGIPGAKVVFEDYFYRFEGVADNSGNFQIQNGFNGDYEVTSGSWGYTPKTTSISVDNMPIPQIELNQGYKDDFQLDLGWQATSTGTNGIGNWELAAPIATFLNNGNPSAPGADLGGDIGNQCYITGAAGGEAGNNDVDAQKVTLTSPTIDLSGYSVPILSLNYWFVNAEGTGTPNDSLSIKISNGTDEVLLLKKGGQNGFWQSVDFDLKSYISLSGNMQLIIETGDQNPGHIVEAGIDGFEIIETDFDGDGFGANDCDDNNPDINPDAVEVPNNNIDEDCDGIALIIDNDMDGFNSDEDCDDDNADINPDAVEVPNNNIDEDCDGIALVIDNDIDGFNSDEDCDDDNADINPDAVEVPNNNIDEDCDGIALIIDNDMDGFNSDEDCDDDNADINPDAVEVPNNNIDEDCDGIALIIDNDMDGFNSDEDCDDNNPDINPDAVEVPNNNIDEDCDGIALIIDNDMDGFNSDEDCDDENPDINPDAVEVPNNNIDEDCDGIALIIDNDMDGFNSDEDCDDDNADINPDAVEVPNNNIDEDCDGIALIIDNDMDGFNSDEDCDDENPDINPDAVEIPDNGIDEDCDGKDATSSTLNVELNSLVLFPNPFEDKVAIRTEYSGQLNIRIFDLSGKMVFQSQYRSSEEFLITELRELNQGVYTVQINSEEGKTVYRKLVKIK